MVAASSLPLLGLLASVAAPQLCSAVRHRDAPGADDPRLKLFAATMNGANKLVADYRSVLQDTALRGHEDADLIVLGVQETTFSNKDAAMSRGLFDGAPISSAQMYEEHLETTDFLSAVKKSFFCLFPSLHIFLNPRSDWKMSKRKSWTTNNGKTKECGKHVNYMTVEVTHEPTNKSISICALNSHLSYQGMANTRANTIRNGISQINAQFPGGCDMTVFVADFNSRLHCKDPEAKINYGPVYDSNLVTFLTIVCPPDTVDISDGALIPKDWDPLTTCTLDGGPAAHYDEMTLMLSPRVHNCDGEPCAGSCYEKPTCDDDRCNTTVGANRYDLKVVDSLLDLGVYEAGKVHFPPTYRLQKRDHEEMDRLVADRRAIFGAEDATWVYANPAVKPTNNAAWTDRVLLKNSKRVTVTTHYYDRRLLAASDFEKGGPDHAPVVAFLNIRVHPDAKAKKIVKLPKVN